ncbi:MAG: 4Fe-4S dicluster domain-containing protein [Deltaproteobacteria bacterium]|nr:4Fe-4S dicluster domain-containing protein [Deltaproteobacteria bacterium]
MSKDARDAKVYRKLQQKLDKLPIAFPATASGVEIRLLKHLFTPEQAQIALSMSFIPEPAAVIRKRLKKHPPVLAELEGSLEQMAARGSIARSITKEGVKIFSITMLAIGMFEFQVEQLTKAFYEDFKQYIDEAFRDALLHPKFTQLRPVPTTGSITPDLNIMPYDDIRCVLTEHRGPFRVVDCICKKGQDLLDQPCQVTKDREICLIFGSAARNYQALGWGRELTRQEVFAILDKAEQDGLVVQPSNSQYPFCACLCCGCCCEVLANAKRMENPARLFYANYVAVNDAALCSGCGLCIDRCQMEAIAMEEDKSRVDPGRCIGCGLCTTVCATKAIRMQKKDPITVPKKDTTQFYLTLMQARAGNARMFLMMIRRVLGMTVP